jgi:cysteinyl-tRNA synthetase
MPIEDLESGARIAVDEIKEDPLDFALWKAAKPGEPAWKSPWGMGRPGWHIECSAMVKRYLGETIDIHCGGVDLTFPHHENEIAQSEAATGKPFSRYWMHNGFINVDNQKMSKSLNNFFTVRDVAKIYGYMPIRYFLVSSHYRKPINYSADIIEAAQNSVDRIQNCYDNLAFYLKNAPSGEPLSAEKKAAFEGYKAQFIEKMDDDFNTADAVSALFEMVRELNSLLAQNPSKEAAAEAGAYFTEIAKLMGLIGESATDKAFAEEVEALIAERAAAKKAKDFARADAIRAQLSDMGVTLQDTAQGTKWKKN